MTDEDPALQRCGQSTFNRFFYDGENDILLIHHKGKILVLPVNQPSVEQPVPEPKDEKVHPAYVFMAAFSVMLCLGLVIGTLLVTVHQVMR
jgi:hypothetical protein